MQCNKCGGELDMTIMYMSMPPQYKCKSCGAYTSESHELKPGGIVEGNIRNITSTCKCCDGSGIQTKMDGIKIRCPECNGTGVWNVFPNGGIKWNGDWTCRKTKDLTNYKIGDDLNAPKVGDFLDQLNETTCKQ